MDYVEMNKFQWEIKRLEKMSLILADRLNEKIDECEELKNRLDTEKAVHHLVYSENKILREENKRLGAALNQILDNCSDPKTMHNLRDLVTTVVMLGSEALHGDR